MEINELKIALAPPPNFNIVPAPMPGSGLAWPDMVSTRQSWYAQPVLVDPAMLLLMALAEPCWL